MPRDRFKFIKKYIGKRPNYYDTRIWEDALQNHYNIVGPCADAALHNKNCYWHIVEEKGQDILKAITQITNTYYQIKNRKLTSDDGKEYDFKPQYFIIIASNLRLKKVRWGRSRKGHFLVDRNRKKDKVIKIDKIPVRLIYHDIIHGKKKFPEDFDKIMEEL